MGDRACVGDDCYPNGRCDVCDPKPHEYRIDEDGDIEYLSPPDMGWSDENFSRVCVVLSERFVFVEALESVLRLPDEDVARLNDATLNELWSSFYDFEGNAVGGCLHIVTDDGNLSDDSVQGCVDCAEAEGDKAAVLFGRLLLRLDMRRRWAAYTGVTSDEASRIAELRTRLYAAEFPAEALGVEGDPERALSALLAATVDRFGTTRRKWEPEARYGGALYEVWRTWFGGGGHLYTAPTAWEALARAVVDEVAHPVGD